MTTHHTYIFMCTLMGKILATFGPSSTGHLIFDFVIYCLTPNFRICLEYIDDGSHFLLLDCLNILYFSLTLYVTLAITYHVLKYVNLKLYRPYFP
jgi:hypothetical protein